MKRELARLWMLLTLPGGGWKARRYRLAEEGWSFAARHLPPKLAYHAFIHTAVQHMRPDEIVPEVRYATLLERVDNGEVPEGGRQPWLRSI